MIFSLPVSEVYDVIWLWQKAVEFWEDEDENGMNQLILICVVFMLLFKVIVFAVMWKASLNFKKFLQQQRDLVGLK